MGRPSSGGHIRKFPRHNTSYRLISVEVDGVRRQRFEHRLVMEKILGRPLARSEIVHHIDGNGLNNEASNLEVMSAREHQRLHLMTGPQKWNLQGAIALRAQGLTLDKIADHYGVTWGAVRKGFAAHGINTKNARHGTLCWDLSKAVSMYKAGSTIRAIAESAGVAPASIRKAFLKRGIITP